MRFPVNLPADAMAKAVDSCVGAAYALQLAPYKTLGEEMDSPHCIVLMKEVPKARSRLRGPALRTAVWLHDSRHRLPFWRAYGTCPPFRAHAEKTRHRPVMERSLVRTTMPYPPVSQRCVRQAGSRRQALAPPALRPLDMLPTPRIAPLPERIDTRSRQHAALLTARQNVLAPEINWATARVLARNGVEVVIPRSQGCCGSLSLHTGEADQARDLARHNLRVFPHDVDAIITNAAGCGSGMHEYPLLFAGQPDEDVAQAFAHKVMDISVFLYQLGIETPPPLPQPVRVAYHDACHLAHAQRIPPTRSLLVTVPTRAG